MVKCSICNRPLESDEPISEYKGRSTCEGCFDPIMKAALAIEFDRTPFPVDEWDYEGTREMLAQADEATARTIPGGSGVSDTLGPMFKVDWKPRIPSLQEKLENRIKWWLRPRIEPALRRIAGWLDFYLED